MGELILGVAGLLVVAAVSLLVGYRIGRLRQTRTAVDEQPAEWQILEIAYRDKARTQELDRFLWSRRYKSYDEAMRAVKRFEGEDTLKNRFDREYLAVEAP
ncbi:hypothetical protein [Nonomuraea typhae]|uniref:hypothetical protein n=1 Tax=Nonomuraea typhae TaxID=2603600 RepID=UPI0012FA92CC|nr:hypothetical protein [Nonomuraea typhae]